MTDSAPRRDSSDQPPDPVRPGNLKVLGIVGGIASGKSHVAGIFARMGAAVIDADAIGHRVLKQPEVIRAACHRWGGSVLGPSGDLHRRGIAERVFAPGPHGEEERNFWNSVTHPRIRQEIWRQLDELRGSGETRVAVLDAALLWEGGWDQVCDAVVFVDAPWEVRRNRVQARGWSDELLVNREASQWSLEEKRRNSDYVIDNSGDDASTYEQALEVWKNFSD